MITAVKDIGEILLEREKKEPLDILIENPDSGGKYDTALVLEFDKDLKFQKVKAEELKKENYKIYLYKRGASQGVDFSPTSRITTVEKTFNRFINWFKNHKNILDFEKILDEIEKNKEEIFNQLDELNNQSQDEKIITIKIDGKYPYEMEIFRKVFLEDIFAKVMEVSKKNGVCSVCGEEKEKVFATSKLYTFFTTDKECYIAGGFRKDEAFKNFPVCEECFLKVSYGRKYIDENLKFKFYSKNYYLIPHLLLDSKEALEEIAEILSFDKEDIKKLSKSEKKKYFSDKDEILDIVKDYKDFVSFYFLFLKGGGTSDKDRILLLVEDVLPSRIHKVFEAKEEVEKKFNIDNYHFGKIGQFLNEFDKLFFEIVDKIFTEGKLDYKVLIKIFMKKIRTQFLNSSKTPYETVKDSVANILFFQELSLIKFGERKMKKEKFEEIFEKFGGALDTPAKKGIFLLGALTQMLLDIQGIERQSTPFWKNLKSLKMNEEDIKGLLPKVVNKLEEYGRNDKGKKELAKEISKYLLQQNKFGLTIDEINFYFVAGMTLHEEIEKNLYNQEENNEPDN